MIKIIVSLSFICVMGFACQAQNWQAASAEQKKEILNLIAQTNLATNSFECPFVQKKNISVLSETIESRGTMYYKKPDKLRWQYDTPYKYIFILNGDKVFIKNENRTDEFNTSSNKLFREISDLMVGSINGRMLVDETRFTAVFNVNSKLVQITLTPKNKELKQMMSSIVLTFNKNDWMVQSIIMNETGGDNTTITFTEKHVNKELSDNLFVVY